MRHDSTNPDDPKHCNCETEVWMCDGGPIDVAIDAGGCPVNPRYCKQHAGATALAVAIGAVFTITIAVANLTQARVRGIVAEASVPGAAIPGISALPNIRFTSMLLLQNQLISGTIPGTRFAHDVTGPNFSGFAAWVRGNMGTAGGTFVAVGVNASAVVLDVTVSVDVDGVVA